MEKISHRINSLIFLPVELMMHFPSTTLLKLFLLKEQIQKANQAFTQH